MPTTATALMPNPRQRYYDNAGLPLVNGMLYTYDAGTSNLATTWQDEAGTVEHLNPIRLDENGEATIYWTVGASYKIDLKTALGLQVRGYPVDNYKGTVTVAQLGSATGSALIRGAWFGGVLAYVSDLGTLLGASLIGFIQAGVGAVLRSVQAELRARPVTPQQFGALGDGVANDALAIQRAIDTGRDVYFPDGNYLLGSALTVNTIRQNLYWSGNAILKAGFAGAAAITVAVEWVTFHNPKIQNAAGFNATSANGVANFVLINHWYFTARGGVIGGTGVGKYARAFNFASFAAGPPMVGGYVSTLDGVRMDGADSTVSPAAVRYGEQSNLQRVINCHMTNYAANVVIDGSFPGLMALGNCHEGSERGYEFNVSARHQDGLLASVIDDKYFENCGCAFYFANGDIHNLTIRNPYVSGRGAGSYFLQVADAAALGVLDNIVIDSPYVQNVAEIFKMGTSLIAKTNWKVSRVTIGAGVTSYASGNFAEQVMMYNDPPSVSTFDTFGGTYPVTTYIDAKQNNNIFTNTNAGGETRFQLPSMGANYYNRSYLGMQMTFTRVVGYSMKIYPNTGQSFAGQGAGKYLELTGTGSVTIMCTGINWGIISSSATIAYEP